MSELLNNHYETDKGPAGPIFYLVENTNNRVALAHFIAEQMEYPQITVIDNPIGQEHSEAILHDLCIKFAKNGHKELVVEEDEVLSNRYINASAIMRKGGIMLKIENNEDFNLENLFMELDALFPQKFDS